MCFDIWLKAVISRALISIFVIKKTKSGQKVLSAAGKYISVV